MRINGIDSVDPSNLRIEPTNHFDVNINKLKREETHLTYETKLNGFNMAKLMSNSGKVTVAPQDLKSNIFDKLRDWNNESPRGEITSLFVDLEGERKTGDITVEWYNDSRQDESGITMNITQNNKTASYFVDNSGNNSQVRVRHVENRGDMTYSHDLASLRSCLNTIVSENAKNATIGQKLATEETVKTEKQIPDVSPQKATPSERAQLPQSIQSRLDEINNIKDNLQNLIGDDRIEQDAINTKMEHVNNAVKMYNDLFQTHPEKATTYLERFESSLDNIKAELDAKTSSYLEHDASDFEAALRMLEETDNLSQ